MDAKTKTATGVGTGIAACAIVAALSVVAPGDAAFEMDYTIEREHEYAHSLVLDAPEGLTADIVELKVNGELVTECVLPDNKLTTVPVVFEDIHNCSLVLYKKGEEVGRGNFDEAGKLTVTVDSSAYDEKAGE